MATFALEHKQSKEECKFRGKDMKTQIGSTFRIRHAVIFMLFMSTTVGYATRVSMSLAIVAMTTENDYGYQVFDWDDAVQDTILSSFFWGYIVFQVPAGLLAGRYGGKYLAFVSLLSSGIINLFVPLAAYYGDWYAVCACRILMGLGQGLLYPSIHGLLSHWAPITERSRMGSIVYAGSQLGTIVEMMTAGLLSASRWGWPSVYYVAGLICLVWSAVWLIIGASKPSESRWISKEERKYIEMNTGPTEVDSSKKMSTPWKGIWTSLSFWAILLANCGQCLGFWTLLTEIPIYMNRVLGVDIKSNGLLSALPYTAMYILSFIFSWSAELLVNRNIITLRAARKIFNTIGFWGSAAALLILSYLPPGHLNIAVLALTITVGLNGAHYVGYLITHIDISPNFASVLMGITNCFGNIFSIIAPLSASLFVRDKSSASDWRNLFFISIAFYFLSNLFFILFMSGKIEDWNEPQPTGKSLVSAWGQRHQQCLILFVSLTVAYSVRACMGVALVAMIKDGNTNRTLIYNNTDNTLKNYTVNVNMSHQDDMEYEWVPDGILNALMLVPPYPKFQWNTKIQNVVLSSFFWGYTLLQIPSGYLAHRFGARFMLSGAMLVNCVLSICLPWLAYYGGWVCTVLCRAMQGLGQACIMPGLHTFFGKWTPLHERGRLTAITYGGQALGPVLGFPLTGFIAASPMGWPGIFRFYGVLSGLVGALIWWKCADTPAKHQNISVNEKQYIEESLGQKHLGKEVLRVPWCQIFGSPGMYAIILAHIGNTWGQLTLYTQVPSFMNKVMGVNIKDNGMLSALPYLTMFFANLVFSWVTDMLLVKNILSVTNVRKLATFTGHGMAALGFVVLAFVPKDIYVVEILLVFICSFNIASHLGFQVNHIDISPNFAGPLMSLSNFSSNLCGSLAPIVAGFILTDDTSEYLWRQVFLVAAGIYTVTVIVYLIFGTGEKADWNEPMDTNDKFDKEGQQIPMIKKQNT